MRNVKWEGINNGTAAANCSTRVCSFVKKHRLEGLFVMILDSVVSWGSTCKKV